jgi:hypothetical protein
MLKLSGPPNLVEAAVNVADADRELWKLRREDDDQPLDRPAEYVFKKWQKLDTAINELVDVAAKYTP